MTAITANIYLSSRIARTNGKVEVIDSISEQYSLHVASPLVAGDETVVQNCKISSTVCERWTGDKSRGEEYSGGWFEVGYVFFFALCLAVGYDVLCSVVLWYAMSCGSVFHYAILAFQS